MRCTEHLSNVSFQVELHFFAKEPQRSKPMTAFKKKIFE
jgi:hypothetical protein